MALSCTHVTPVCLGSPSRKVTIPLVVPEFAAKSSNVADRTATSVHLMNETICFIPDCGYLRFSIFDSRGSIVSWFCQRARFAPAQKYGLALLLSISSRWLAPDLHPPFALAGIKASPARRVLDVTWGIRWQRLGGL